MTATALSLGGVTLTQADKNGITIDQIPIAVAQRMFNGTLRVQYRTTKRRVTVAWKGLTAAQKTTLQTQWLAAFLASKVLVLPDATTLTVMCSTNSWNETHWYDYHDTPWYDVALTFEEV